MPKSWAASVASLPLLTWLQHWAVPVEQEPLLSVAEAEELELPNWGAAETTAAAERRARTVENFIVG